MVIAIIKKNIGFLAIVAMVHMHMHSLQLLENCLDFLLKPARVKRLSKILFQQRNR